MTESDVVLGLQEVRDKIKSACLNRPLVSLSDCCMVGLTSLLGFQPVLTLLMIGKVIM